MAVVAIRTDIACPPLTASTVQVNSNSKQPKNSCVYALQIAKIGVTVILNSVNLRQPKKEGHTELIQGFLMFLIHLLFQ